LTELDHTIVLKIYADSGDMAKILTELKEEGGSD
jgi:hypothetical protein